MNFAQRNSPSNHLFFENRILKINDQINLNACLFTHAAVNFNLPPVFNDWFGFSRDSHSYHTRYSQLGSLCLNHYNTHQYGKYSPQNSCIKVWNFLQENVPSTSFETMFPRELKKTLTCHHIQSYTV